MRCVMAAALAAIVCDLSFHSGLEAQTAAGSPGECVSINKPDARTIYVFQHTDSSGAVTEVSQQWLEVSETGSRARVTRRGTASIQTTRHAVKNDITLIALMSGSSGTTRFSPAMVGDPLFKACAGQSWAIPAVTATHDGGGRSASAATPSGQLRIIAVREQVTLPAGKFQTVHYTRITKLPIGQTVNHYWKSIDHGVVVQHTATLPNGRASEVLTAIKH